MVPQDAFRAVDDALDAWTRCIEHIAQAERFETQAEERNGVTIEHDALDDLTGQLLSSPGYAHVPAVYLFAVLDEHERREVA
jgi:hypothetical protein